MVPFYLSGGDPRKDFNFIYAMSYNPIHFNLKSSFWSEALNILFNASICTYVSLLAEKVTLPPRELDIEPTMVGNLNFPFVKGYRLGNIQVQYLEDNLGLVNWFHSVWQNSIRGGDPSWIESAVMGGDSSGSGMLFQEIGKFTGCIAYAPTKRIFVPSKDFYNKSSMEITADTALTADVYPSVFPQSITTTPGDKTGANLSRVNVDFMRIPSLGHLTAKAYSSLELRAQNVDSIGSVKLFN